MNVWNCMCFWRFMKLTVCCDDRTVCQERERERSESQTALLSMRSIWCPTGGVSRTDPAHPLPWPGKVLRSRFFRLCMWSQRSCALWITRSCSGFITYGVAGTPWKSFPIAVHVMNIRLTRYRDNALVRVLMANSQ